MRQRETTGGGFTLIELLVVIVIIGILALIGIPQLSQARDEAFFSTLSQELRNMTAAQERFFHSNGEYASDPELLDAEAPEDITIEVVEASGQGWSAVARHRNLAADRGCAVYLGNATPPELPNGEPHGAGVGLVICTPR